MSELLKLAERCEKATGPDRELDKAIALARFGAEHCRYIEIPTYTASIDAAMTLVPEYGRIHFGPDRAEAGCSGLKCMSTWSKAATPALALCAAALRARAMSGGEDRE